MSITQLSTPTKWEDVLSKSLSEDYESKPSVAVIHSDSLVESIYNKIITETGDPSNNDEIYLTNKKEGLLPTVTCSNSSKIELDQSNTNNSSETLHAKENANMNNINIEKISTCLDQQCIRHMHAQEIVQKCIVVIEALENIGSTLSKDELRNYLDELSQYREELFNEQILSIKNKLITKRIEQKIKKISSDYQSALDELEILKDENLKLIIIQNKLIEEKKKTLDKCNEFFMSFCLDAEKISGQLKVFLLKLALSTQKEEARFREELQNIDIKEKLESLKNTKLEKENLEKQLEKENLEKKMEKEKLEKEKLEKEKMKEELEKEKLAKHKLNIEMERTKVYTENLVKEIEKLRSEKQQVILEKDLLEKGMAKNIQRISSSVGSLHEKLKYDDYYY